MLKNLKVGVRLAASFVIMIGFLAVIMFFSISRLNILSQNVEKLVGDRFPKVIYINDAIDQVNFIAQSMRNLLLVNTLGAMQAEENKIRVAREKTGKIIEDFTAKIKFEEERKLMAAVQAERVKIIAAQDQMIPMVADGRTAEMTAMLMGDYQDIQDAYIKSWYDFLQYQMRIVEEEGAATRALNTQSLRLLYVIGGAAALLAILLALLITNSIVKPLSVCITAADHIAQGDLKVTLDEKGKDELATLQRAMRAMANTLTEMVTEAARISDSAVVGRLTDRAHTDGFQGSYKDLVNGINEIIQGLVGFIDNIPTPAMIIDKNYQVLFMNKAGAKLGNSTGKELVDTRKRCYDFFKTGDCKSERCACNQAMRIGGEANSQTTASPLDKVYDIAYTGVPVLDREGQTVGALEVITDQTAIKSAERKMLKIADFQNGEITKLNDFLNQVAQGDLSGNFLVAGADEDTRETKERLDSLATALNAMIDSINDILGQVAQAVEQVTAGSQQVSQASQALSQGATEQASSLEEITSSVTEIAGQTRQNTDSSVQVNALAAEARDSASAGDGQMKDLVSAMADVNKSAEEIRKVVKAIDDISFQINLLALNANVEAARAGKYGKGFAVVAEEVRNLAVRSATSVKETTSMVDEVIKNIGRGNTLVDVTAKQLGTIVTGVTQVAGLAEEVATASREQSQGLEQITQGLNQIDQVTQSNTASAEESASAAEELSSQAQQLKGMVGRFKLKADQRSGASWHAGEEPAPRYADQGRSPAGAGPGAKPRALALHRDELAKHAAPAGAGARRLVNPADIISLDDDDFGKF